MALLPSDEFERPVIILAGLGHPTAITGAMDAYMFLADWPKAQRDVVHGLASKACLAAVRGEIEPETARGLFLSWTERHDILAPNIASFAGGKDKGSHGTA